MTGHDPRPARDLEHGHDECYPHIMAFNSRNTDSVYGPGRLSSRHAPSLIADRTSLYNLGCAVTREIQKLAGKT